MAEVTPLSVSSLNSTPAQLDVLQSGSQSERLSIVSSIFEDVFGLQPAVSARAGGRVNLIGEHVDYPQSQFTGDDPAHLYSLGGAVGEEYLVCVSLTEDGICAIGHANANELFTIELDQISAYEKAAAEEREAGVPMSQRSLPVWGYHTLGTLNEVLKKGVGLSGVRILLTSSVPHGAGMSNSAANCVSLALAFNRFYPELQLDDKTALAAFAREGENSLFVGGHCGFLDQLLICHSQADALTKIDYADKSIQHFSSQLPASMQFLAYNTNVPHVLAESEYPDRVRELECAHEFLTEVFEAPMNSTTLSLESLNRIIKSFDPNSHGVRLPTGGDEILTQGRVLSDAEITKVVARGQQWTVADLPRHVGCSAAESVCILMKRVRHQKASSLIVPLAGSAAAEGDAHLFGTLLDAEGASLRMSGDFQITGDNGAQDKLLDAGFEAGIKTGIQVYGRMLGGGGGGNVLFFTDRSDESRYCEWKELTAKIYEDWTETAFESRISSTVIEPVIAPGASVFNAP